VIAVTERWRKRRVGTSTTPTQEDDVTDPEMEPTGGGLLGRLAGRAKAAAGALTGNQDLAREGRLQEAKVQAADDAARSAAQARVREQQAEVEATRQDNALEREHLEAEVAADEREARIEHDRRRAEQQAAAREVREKEQARELEQSAEEERLGAAAQALRLEQEARRAEAGADAIDPEERA